MRYFWIFFTLIKSLYVLGKFSKKVSLCFLRFSPEFRSSNIYAVTEHTRNQFFFERYPKNFFLNIFTMVLLDGFINGFSKFWFFIVEICILVRDFWVIFENYCLGMQRICGNDFIACWAYEERISSHAEHMPNEFSRMLSVRWNFDSFYMDIWTHAEQTGQRFHHMLSIRGNDFIAR
jgi:hypothetical protein